MRRYIIIILIMCNQILMAQTGINTDDPKVSLHVKSNPSDALAVEGIIPPLISGNNLKAKDNLYGVDQKGTVVYVTAAANPRTTKTELVTNKGYYYFDGAIWRAFEDDTIVVNDATRFLGGTVYVTFNSLQSDGSSFDRVIAPELNGKYQVGTSEEIPRRGGVDIIRGNGYTISNPANGVFDIKFDKPYIEIFGISVNLLDSYGQHAKGSITAGKMPELDVPGNPLYTNDNTQVAYISNSIIRIKTGNEPGTKSNRSFTFLVTGK